MKTPRRFWSRSALRLLWLAGLILLILLWIAEISTGFAAHRLARGLTVLTALTALGHLGFGLGEVIRGLLSRRRPARRRQAWRRLLLPTLMLVALALRWTGIEHEVEERTYRDEGTYYHHAAAINDGEPLRYSFVYPHFLYYADAFVLWLIALFPGAWSWICSTFFGVQEALGGKWLALRLAAAALSAAATAPVFFAARSLSQPLRRGYLGGTLGALLYIFSPLVNEAAHLNISDGPSASWAAFCFGACAWIAVREGRGPYLKAGIYSGLAAATKYPAGTVASAVVAAWLAQRWRGLMPSGRKLKPQKTRRWRLPLLFLAGAASLSAFLLSMPSLLVYPQQALFGGRGIFFGLRQYGGAGWIGVMPESHGAFYGKHLVASFSSAILLLGLLGLLILLIRPSTFAISPSLAAARRARWRLIALLPFPALYLALLVSMNMVVRRNLYPAVPALAALLGAGLAILLPWSLTLLWRRLGRSEESSRGFPAAAWRGVLLALLLGVLFFAPVRSTWQQALGYAHPSTRDVARQWLETHLPPGATVVQEAYTPRLDPGRFTTVRHRFVGRMRLDELVQPQHEVVMLTWNAYGRFLDEANWREPHHRDYAERYRHILEHFQPLWQITPGPTRRGPAITVYRIPPPAADSASATSAVPLADAPVDTLTDGAPVDGPRFRAPARQLFVPDGSMRPETDGQPVRYTRPGQWALARFRVPPGEYRAILRGDLRGPASLRLKRFVAPAAEDQLLPLPEPEELLRLDRDIPEVDPAARQEAGSPLRVPLELPVAEGTDDLPTYFLYVYLAEGSSLKSVQLRPRIPAAASPQVD